MMAGDGNTVGTVLENLLDAQQRRTDAEGEWTSAQVDYLASLVDLQRAMGTLLTRSGIRPVQHGGQGVEFIHSGDNLLPADTSALQALGPAEVLADRSNE